MPIPRAPYDDTEFHNPLSMTYSQALYDFVAKEEGLILHAYDDGGGTLTIGYGHTANVHDGEHISDEQATAYLHADLDAAARLVRCCVTVPLRQTQFDALTSFTFNVGGGALIRSTLLKKLNKQDYAGADHEFLKWVNVRGKEMLGLKRRRAREAELFAS